MKKFKAILAAILIWLAGACCAGDPSYKLRNEYNDGAMSYGVATAIDAHTVITAKHLIHKSKDEETFIRTQEGWMQCDFVKDAEGGADLCELRCRVALKDYAPMVAAATGPVEIRGGNKKTRETFKATVVDATTVKCPEYSHGSSGAPLVQDGGVLGVTTGMRADSKGQPNGNVAVIPAVEVKRALAWDVAAEIVILPDETPRAVVLSPTFSAQKTMFCKSCQTQVRALTEKVLQKITAKSSHWEADDGYGQGHYVSD